MTPVAVIHFAERKNRRDPLEVYLVTDDRIIATGDPDYAAGRHCRSFNESFNQMSEEDRRASVVEFLDRQQRPNVNALPPEVVPYTGKNKKRVDGIIADFMNRSSDRLLKKKL